MRRAWATAVLVALAGLAPPAAGQPLPPADPPQSRPPSIFDAPIAVKAEPARPAAEPIPVAAPDLPATPAAFTESPAAPRPGRAAGLRAPVAAGGGVAASASARVPASALDGPARPPAVATPSDPVNDLLLRRAGAKEPAPPPGRDDRDAPGRPARKIGDRLNGLFENQNGWFQSDHAFDGFASPVTNPFLFEDPRSLTELRGLYLYQGIPSRQPDFDGGHASFFGLQGRLAITDRFSLVLHKLGGVRLDPASGSTFPDETGFAEIWLGPKYTFVRDEQAGRLVAGGLQFQIPIGSASVFQDTGSLSLVPYVSYAENFFPNFQFGSVNALATGGYAFSTTAARSDYLYLSGHLDLDVMNLHRFYPLFELNYFLVTTNGDARPYFGSEGRDLFNFGGQASGNGLLTAAFGGRVKAWEKAWFGGAIEFPIAGPRDLFDYRFTLDFTWRF